MPQDAITLLTEDHRAVERLYRQLDAGATDQPKLLDSIVRELSVHDAIEKEFLYPAVRSRVDGGKAIADRALGEHQKVEDLLAEVERAGNDTGAARAAMRQTMDNVAEHVAEEESIIFPALRSALSPGELTDLGEKLERAKAVAPTHPHPASPNSGPGAAVGGMIAGLADKAKDALSGRPADK